MAEEKKGSGGIGNVIFIVVILLALGGGILFLNTAISSSFDDMGAKIEGIKGDTLSIASIKQKIDRLDKQIKEIQAKLEEPPPPPPAPAVDPAAAPAADAAAAPAAPEPKAEEKKATP